MTPWPLQSLKTAVHPEKVYVSRYHRFDMSNRINSTLVRGLLQSLLALLLSSPIILLVLTLQTTPAVTARPALDSNEIALIEQILLENTPQSPANASQQQLHIDADELNLLLRYGIEVLGRGTDWLASATLQENLLATDISVRVSSRALPLYLNMHAEFGVHEDSLQLDSLQFGELKVPDRFLLFFLNQLREEIDPSSLAYQDFSALFRNVESVEVNAEGMQVLLNWDPQLIARLLDHAQQLFISEADKLLIAAHYQQIADVTVTIPVDLRAVSLNTFLVPLFTTALANSSAGADPVAQNRTLFQALAIYVNEEDIAQLIGSDKAANITPPRKVEVRLRRRQDLAQHVVSVAAITASAGAGIAAMLSTTKEAYDARYRSGFSFSDLTANSVGVSMARLATKDAVTALLMQERLANVTSEEDYMPEVGNNRDGLSEVDFNALYQDRSSPEYQQRLSQIEELIATRPLFQDIPL